MFTKQRTSDWHWLHHSLSPCVLLVLSVYLGFIAAAIDGKTRESSEVESWALRTLTGLTLEEKVGQMLQVRYYVTDSGSAISDVRYAQEALQKYKVGSFVLGMHFDKSGPIRMSAVHAATIANRLQRESKIPLLLAADLERGVASRLRGVPDFPWPMALGAAGDTHEVERFAGVTAQEARAVGIHR